MTLAAARGPLLLEVAHTGRAQLLRQHCVGRHLCERFAFLHDGSHVNLRSNSTHVSQWMKKDAPATARRASTWQTEAIAPASVQPTNLLDPCEPKLTSLAAGQNLAIVAQSFTDQRLA